MYHVQQRCLNRYRRPLGRGMEIAGRRKSAEDIASIGMTRARGRTGYPDLQGYVFAVRFGGILVRRRRS
jgi:hypothetical protein